MRRHVRWIATDQCCRARDRSAAADCLRPAADSRCSRACPSAAGSPLRSAAIACSIDACDQGCAGSASSAARARAGIAAMPPKAIRALSITVVVDLDDECPRKRPRCPDRNASTPCSSRSSARSFGCGTMTPTTNSPGASPCADSRDRTAPVGRSASSRPRRSSTCAPARSAPASSRRSASRSRCCRTSVPELQTGGEAKRRARSRQLRIARERWRASASVSDTAAPIQVPASPRSSMRFSSATSPSRRAAAARADAS